MIAVNTHSKGVQEGRSTRACAITLGAILVVSAVFQFYRLNDWQTFADDQATQLNVVHGMLVDHHLPLLGLALSVGQAHIGPLFYYLLAAPMWLGRALVGYLDPTAGVALIGVFQVATVYLLYRLCLLVEAPWAGLCAAGLYATSGLVVYWSRFLWPNIAPFFVVLALYALVAIAQGRPRFIVLLAGSLAAAAQMQPTAVLLIPVAAVWLLAVRPRLTPRLVLLSGALVAVLFAPVIIYDLTHHFAETRAWLAYNATVRPGAAPRNGLARGVQELERFAWRAVGFRARSRVDLLLTLAALAVAAYAAGLGGRPRALLARLLLLWGAIYLLAFALYRGALHPHYVEPLYPLPFLAIGLLLDLLVMAPSALARGQRGVRAVQGIPWDRRLPAGPREGDAAGRQDAGGSRTTPRIPALNHAPGTSADKRIGALWHRLRTPIGIALRAGTAVLVVGLAAANVRHLWADQFGLDSFQLDNPADVPGNRVMLGEMRRAADLIAHSAAGEPYSFLLAVRDGAGGGFAYLQRQTTKPPDASLRPLQFLLVEPADRPPWLWPAATRARWSHSSGGFVRLPHLLLWKMQVGGASPGADPPGQWQTGAGMGGAATAITALPVGDHRLVAGYIGGAAILGPRAHAWHGAAWPAGPNGRAVISAFAWSPACPQHLYAATFDGLLASPDSGATWRPTRAQPASPEVLTLLADPRRCATLLAGTRAGIAWTADGGTHWRSVVVGRGLAVQALARGSGETIYAGTTDGVWISRDGGRTWPARPQRREPRPALSLLVHSGGAPILLAGSGAGLLYSADDGATWAQIGASLHATVYCLLDVDRRSTLLAGTDAGLYISHNNGAWWQPPPLPPPGAVQALARGPGGAIYAASSAGVYQSLDGGNTWQHL